MSEPILGRRQFVLLGGTAGAYLLAQWAVRPMNVRIGPISRLLSPTYGACERCGTTWKYVKGHPTFYTQTWGMSPLCEKCWMDLTPEERVPYYRQLYERWGQPETERWDAIQAAVLAGG